MQRQVNLRLADLTVPQVLSSRHDATAVLLPDLVPLVEGGASLVSWRSDEEPVELRVAAAKVLLERYAAPSDALRTLGYDALSPDERAYIRGLVADRPSDVLRLATELARAGIPLSTFLRHSAHMLGRIRLAPVDPPWVLAAVAQLTRSGYRWDSQTRTIRIDPVDLVRQEQAAEARYVVLGQAINVVARDRDAMIFTAGVRPGGSGPPTHAHVAVDQLELCAVGAVNFNVGGVARRLRAGEFVAVPRLTPHRFAPELATDSTITSVVLGKGVSALSAFFKAFDGTPDPVGLGERDRLRLMRSVYMAYPLYGLRSDFSPASEAV